MRSQTEPESFPTSSLLLWLMGNHDIQEWKRKGWGEEIWDRTAPTCCRPHPQLGTSLLTACWVSQRLSPAWLRGQEDPRSARFEVLRSSQACSAPSALKERNRWAVQPSTAPQQQERSEFRPVTDNGFKICVSVKCGSLFLRTHDLEHLSFIWGKEEGKKKHLTQQQGEPPLRRQAWY